MKRQRLCIAVVSRVAAAVWVAGVVSVAGMMSSCASVPGPTAEQIKERDYWGSKVPTQQRELIEEDVRRHTNWSEEKQIEMEIKAYHDIAVGHKPRTSASRPATKPGMTPGMTPSSN